MTAATVVWIATHLSPYRYPMLLRALRSLENQTVKPDKILIGMSLEPSVDINIIEIQKACPSIPLAIYLSSTRKFQVGHWVTLWKYTPKDPETRIVLHDDDDISLPKRIEVINASDHDIVTVPHFIECEGAERHVLEGRETGCFMYRRKCLEEFFRGGIWLENAFTPGAEYGGDSSMKYCVEFSEVKWSKLRSTVAEAGYVRYLHGENYMWGRH